MAHGGDEGEQGGRGRRRPPRRARASHDDDRPRGFQPQRMQRLWSDIDRARQKLGLDASPAPPSAWSVMNVVDCLAGTAAEVAGWVSALSGLVPETLAATLDRIPLLSRLLALAPRSRSDASER